MDIKLRLSKIPMIRLFHLSFRMQYTKINKLWVLICLLCFQGICLGQYTNESVLSNGTIYKITTRFDGVHQIDYNFLKDELKIDIDNIDPRNIQLYGNGGGLLSENIDYTRIDDLVENHIQITGESDGVFNQGDVILFYGQQADQQVWNNNTNRFTAPKNIYNDEVTYFIKIADQPGLRVSNTQSPANPSYTSTTCDTHIRLEEDLVNLLDDYNGASGTGQAWFGDLYKGIESRTYTINTPDALLGGQGHIQAQFAARSSITSTVQLEIEGQSLSKQIGSVNLADTEGRYARIGTITGGFSIQDSEINISVTYPQNSGDNSGWLDYIEVNLPTQLSTSRSKAPFSDHLSQSHAVSAFRIQGDVSNSTIWDITNPLMPQAVVLEQVDDMMEFSYNSTALRTFVLYNDETRLVPQFDEIAENQNLHAIDDVDMVVLYHSDFADAASRFAEHRSIRSAIEVLPIDIEQVFNEFGSGAPSPVAIRDFAKMLYDRNPDFKYLMLLGDASFDFKNLKNIPNPSNFIPTYETKESLDPIRGFPSDDFFALLSPGEGSSLRGALDIAIGRLPAKTSTEAMVMVDKIIDYETNPDRFGDWMNKVTFVADDEDFNIHLNQADQIADNLSTSFPQFNIEKIYLDAYKQVSTAGGELYPEVQSAINNTINGGTSVINYMGHGGSTGFAQERILTTTDVSNWNNANQLALMVTATCSFTGYDDPNFVTAGERAILNPNGGAIALFTTVRAVYSSSNERLTRAVFDNLYKPVDGTIPPIGEILRIAKNSNAADTLGINARKFLLIGDPSLPLAKPVYQVKTREINDLPLASGIPDTLKALSPITIKGQIEDNGSIISTFNGVVDILIYDKFRSASTLAQDQTSFAKTFKVQKNIIFKGSASVVNGTFSVSFIVPSDIDYQFGQGKISYYAQSDNNIDAAGYFNDIVVGGTSDTPLKDDNGPQIQIFMNNINFVSGGITGRNPTLLVNLEDDYGINIVGNSIGHDITAVLDNQTSNTIILNDFYNSELNNTKVGTVRFPLNDIAAGRHSIEVKAWDIANNSSTSSIEFVVAGDSESAIQQILNYPNPVLDQTNFRIDHNISSGLLDINIEIFTTDGKLVQSLKYMSAANAGRIDNLSWDANTTCGLPMPTGIYLYRVTITNTDDSNEDAIHSQLEKMVILK